jgi:hypothetical protein
MSSCGTSKSSRRSGRGGGTSAVTVAATIRSVRKARIDRRRRAPPDQVPVGRAAHVPQRLDVPDGGRAGAIAVPDPQHAAGGQRVGDEPRHLLTLLLAAEQMHTAGQLACGRRVVGLHGREQLAQAGRGGGVERRAIQSVQRESHRNRLGRRQVDRRQGPRLVQAVAAPAAGLGVDRHPGLLQGGDVALDRARADFEPAGQPVCAARTGSHRAKLFNERIQPVRTVHGSTVNRRCDSFSGRTVRS